MANPARVPRAIRRRLAISRVGFRWHQGVWWRGRVCFSDADLDAWTEAEFTRRLTRWAQRRPALRRKERR